MNLTEKTIDISSQNMITVFGKYDDYVRKIERTLNVTFIDRGEGIKIIGTPGAVDRADRVIVQLIEIAKKGNAITEQDVNYTLSMVYEDNEQVINELNNDLICITSNGKQVKPKTVGQKLYVDEIKKKMITFGIGPAGTGKTYLAMAMAITAFKNNEVSRIILTRPAIEAGEKLGFLPGDLQSKVDPYLRPLYDALYQIMGAETFLRNLEKGLIEVAPLAYMRGRTLDNAFIVLDEAQNTTPPQMKMFLTRIGFGSKAVITGDITQRDLPVGQKSGLNEALNIINNINEIGIVKLSNKDVVRHPLVQKIVEAYDIYEDKESNRKD
ncbi:MAG: Phosphate starvation-inducible protein PhoH, predicted ATPase [Clostridiales bacterium]|jgi:phosphate starvation-inducible PhoH-like protein|nr:Phosphate starvation-inducible protein PhoH, predicted ATPase [Clostridiales bacterium]